MRYRALLVATAMTALVVFALESKRAAADESRPNPPYKNWSAFNVGAFSTLKSVLVDHSGDDPNTIDTTARPEGASEQSTTYKLMQKTAEKIVIEQTDTDIEAGSQTEHSPAKITYPATISTDKPANAGVSGVKEGTEDLEIAGKTIPCHWVESTIKVEEETSMNKMWWSDAVPGGTVKQVTTKKQGDKLFFVRTTTLTEFKTGE
jgi:hypothetical protein